jgi:hypothetical protein
VPASSAVSRMKQTTAQTSPNSLCSTGIFESKLMNIHIVIHSVILFWD